MLMGIRFIAWLWRAQVAQSANPQNIGFIHAMTKLNFWSIILVRARTSSHCTGHCTQGQRALRSN
jgi:hypothetical protein